MPVAHAESGTVIDEITDGIYRISTPVPPPGPGMPGFSFNRYLVVDDAPMLYHTGLRNMFAATRAAIETVMPVEKLRYVAFSHVEADEMGHFFRSLSNFSMVLTASFLETFSCSMIAFTRSLWVAEIMTLRTLGIPSSRK